jgi:hypothetical protein
MTVFSRVSLAHNVGGLANRTNPYRSINLFQHFYALSDHNSGATLIRTKMVHTQYFH